MHTILLLVVLTFPTIGLASPAAYLFGGSQPDGLEGQTLQIQLSNGEAYVASTMTGKLGSESYAENFGWWSDTIGHFEGNYNYFAGDDGSFGSIRNFFSFDLSDLQDTAISASLHLKPYSASYPFTPMRYDLFEVFTSASDLILSSGLNQTIFTDLGTGNHYGSYLFNSDPNTLNEITINLTTAAIDSINSRTNTYFSIGGTVTPVPILSSMILFFSGLVSIRAFRISKVL